MMVVVTGRMRYGMQAQGVVLKLVVAILYQDGVEVFLLI
jgi:hypothetical protein